MGTSDSDTMQAKGPNLVLTLFAAIFLIDLVHSQKVQDLPPLECYVCGKAPHKSCDEFDPHDITFRQKCLDQKHQSCVKSFGAFQNVTVESRRCGEGPALNRCSSISLGGADVLICSCNATLCNTASIPRNSNFIRYHSMTSFIFLMIINNGILK